MKNIFAVLLFAMVCGSVAQARPCLYDNKVQIIQGLEDLSKNPAVTELKRDNAAFALLLIQQDVKITCDYQSGVAGNIYTLQAPTHVIQINFVEDSITNLRFSRTKFN